MASSALGDTLERVVESFVLPGTFPLVPTETLTLPMLAKAEVRMVPVTLGSAPHCLGSVYQDWFLGGGGSQFHCLCCDQISNSMSLHWEPVAEDVGPLPDQPGREGEEK